MRQSRGVLLPPIRASRLRRGDLYHALCGAILEGAVPSGARLPSTRQAAADYGVSRGLMEEVYAQLTDEGFFERAVGRGTFATPAVARLAVPARQRRGAQRSPSLSSRGSEVAANAACREPAVLRPFNAGIADTTEFPWNAWRRLEARAARDLGPGALTFADPRGLRSLRSAIARYLAQFRGVRCQPSQIIIFNSAQQALHALSVLLLDRRDRVWIEDPCFLGARAAFKLAGVEVIPVPVDEEGLRVDAGIRRSPHARLVYITPSHQYPTGATLTLERRIALLEWAARSKAWIVEDDYDGEFRYDGQMLTALHSLDPQARVLYIGTLNKSMFVSLRLAYAVVPERLAESLANVRTQLDGFTPAVRQMAMSLFMDEGLFSAHLRRMRAVYRAKRAALIEALAPLKARGWTWPSTPAGIHLLLSHKHGELVRAIAARSSLDLALLSTYRTARKQDDGLFLRFGALDMASLRKGANGLIAEVSKL